MPSLTSLASTFPIDPFFLVTLPQALQGCLSSFLALSTVCFLYLESSSPKYLYGSFCLSLGLLGEGFFPTPHSIAKCHSPPSQLLIPPNYFLWSYHCHIFHITDGFISFLSISSKCFFFIWYESPVPRRLPGI